MSTNQPTNHYPKFIDQSVEVLVLNLSEIPTVTVWADFMGFSRSYFCTRFARHFGEPPSERLRAIRHRRLNKVIRRHPYETSNSIADRVGLNDEQALYKFLSRHYDTNFTKLRHKVLTER